MKSPGGILTIEWPELDSGVRARLAFDKNPKLCEFFLGLLPLKLLQSHGMVSGDMMLAFHPFTKFMEPEFSEDFRAKKYWGKVPTHMGYVGLKTSSYQSIVIQWGPERTEEEFRVPLAYVLKEDLSILARVGQAVFKGMLTGQAYRVVFSLADPDHREDRENIHA